MRKKTCFFALVSVCIFANDAFAFRDHALLSSFVFSEERESAESPLQKSVPVESLNTFLDTVAKNPNQYTQLVQLLNGVDEYGIQSIPGYKPVPDRLKLAPNSTTLTKAQFLDAARLNPDLPYNTYVRSFLREEDGLSVEGEVDISTQAPFDLGVSYVDNIVPMGEGKQVPAFEVLCTACDEPDYGQDMALWKKPSGEDKYGLGEQPFGGSAAAFSTQAPFHMGFFHEDWIINKMAPAYMESYVEYRIKQYIDLAKFSFKNDHPYWGWRFLGWGLHYVQDLCQPYHTSMVPGVGTAKLLLAGILNKVGISCLQQKYTTLATNLHAGFELCSYGLLNFALDKGLWKTPTVPVSGGDDKLSFAVHPAKSGCCKHHSKPNAGPVVIVGDKAEIVCVLSELLPTLSKVPKASKGPLRLEDYPRQVISAASYALGSDLATVLENGLPADFLVTTNPKSWAELDNETIDIKGFNNKESIDVMKSIFGNISMYSHLFVKEVLSVIKE